MLLNQRIKSEASKAFRDNSRLALMSLEDREIAASYYEYVASITVGLKADLASLYNLERAKFLRGEVSRIVYPATKFDLEIGFSERKSGGSDV